MIFVVQVIQHECHEQHKDLCMIFVVQLIQHECHEQHKDLCMIFVAHLRERDINVENLLVSSKHAGG